MTREHSITVFNAKKPPTKNKFPYSQYDDNTFIFETYKTDDSLKLYNVLVQQWVLNIPINITEPIRTFRRKENLEKYYNEFITYFIIDIDDVMNEEDKNSILYYFKDYKVIIGESSSYNGVDNFNMKGILFLEDTKLSDAKAGIRTINQELSQYCTIDEAVVRKATLNAPIGKSNVIINNKNGELYKIKIKKSNEIISNVAKNYIDKPMAATDATGDTIQELCLNTFKNMGFASIRHNDNGSISFKHPSENKTKGGYFWFNASPYVMHHPNSTRTINIFDMIRKTELGRELMTKEINYDDEFLNFDTNTKVIQVNEKYLKVQGKEEVISEWLNNKDGLLSIKSPMGTAKSTIINHIIEESHEIDMKVLIITNRRSVASDFSRKYNIKLYNRDSYDIGDSLIVQYDSLWKYNIKYFDIVIMDEFISLMMHSRSNLNNSSTNIAKFFGCFNKKLVIADAFLTGYENFLLQQKKTNIVQIDNQYRDSTTLLSYDCKNYFTQELLFQSKFNKITVSSTSLKFLNSTRLILEKRGLKVVMLTAETPDSTKELIYKLFGKENHDKWDVFMYSPTLTVGVSNLNNNPYHFHYDSSMSTDVISSIQMIKRTRKAKEIHMFIDKRTNYLKTSYNDIRDDYMGNMGKNIEQNFLFDIDDYGEAKLSNTGRNAVKIDTFKNILEFNHKKGMYWLLKYHFLVEPREITKTLKESVLSGPAKQLKNNKDLSMKSNIDMYLGLNNIQKTDILMGDDNYDAVMYHLAEIDDNIKDVNDNLREKLLTIALKNRQFITQCRYYRDAFNYTKGIFDLSDIKVRVSKAVINNNSNDLNFYNNLIKLGQSEIFDEYYPRNLKEFKLLKWILDRCGYKVRTIGIEHLYAVNRDVKEYYGYIKH